jgi:hypothetical protein
MARGVKLVRAPSSPTNHAHLRAFCLRIDAAEVIGGMTPYVFVYRRHPADPYDGSIKDEFCTIASPAHLADYPEGEPDLPFPFFRKTYMEVDVRSQQESEEIWALIQKEVCSLTTILDSFDDMVLVDTFICGEEDVSSESASISESVSESM